MLNIPYSKTLQKTVDSLLNKSAHTSTTLRQSTMTFAQQLMRGDGQTTDLPVELTPYVQKVTRHAYRTTDEDIETLIKEAGYSEDEIYELTLCAAVGASLVQLEQGLAALEGENTCA